MRSNLPWVKKHIFVIHTRYEIDGKPDVLTSFVGFDEDEPTDDQVTARGLQMLEAEDIPNAKFICSSLGRPA